MISLQLNGKQSCLVGHGQALIGPFISDVDTTSSASGKVYYELSTSPSLLARASGDIALAYRDENFVPTLLIIATYDHVGYYKNMSDKVSVVLFLIFDLHVISKHIHRSLTRTRLCWQQTARPHTPYFFTTRSSGPPGTPGREKCAQRKWGFTRRTEPSTSLSRRSLILRLFHKLLMSIFPACMCTE